MVKPPWDHKTIPGFDDDLRAYAQLFRSAGNGLGVRIVDRVFKNLIENRPFLAAVKMDDDNDMGIAMGIETLAFLGRDVEILLGHPIAPRGFEDNYKPEEPKPVKDKDTDGFLPLLSEVPF